ncbi:MAG: V-type ATP synthase subunit E family protein [archaeon]
MEGVAKINQKIMKEALAEANKIVSEAKEKAERIKKEEKEKTEVHSKEIEENGKKCAAREEQRILSSSNLQAHNLQLKNKDEMISKVLSKAEAELKRMSKAGTGRYKTALKKLAQEGIDAIGENSTLHFNNENADISKELAKEFNAKIGEARELIGGVIIESKKGDLRIDNSIEKIMERDSEKIRGEIAKILFK